MDIYWSQFYCNQMPIADSSIISVTSHFQDYYKKFIVRAKSAADKCVVCMELKSYE